MQTIHYAIVLGFFVLLVGCDSSEDNGDMEPAPQIQLDPNVAPITQGNWYRPTLAVTWQWQLQGTINTTYEVELYDLDLFDVFNATITELHQKGRRVICYFSAGSAEDFRSDFNQFTAADLGKPLGGFPDERWLDIRSENVFNLMKSRLDLAVDRGCDGVEPDNVNAYQNDTGFNLTETDQLAFNRHLANEAHQRGLSVALKNAGSQAESLVEYFDFELNEQCHEFDECSLYQVFLDQGKPVLNTEYPANQSTATALATSVCPKANAAGLHTLILPLDLDDSFRISCE